MRVVAALADGHLEAVALAQDHADRADRHGGAIGSRDVGVAKAAGGAVHDQVRADAAPAEGEHVLAVDVAAGAHAELAQDAAVEIEQHVGVRGIDRPVRVEVVEVRRQHAEIVGRWPAAGSCRSSRRRGRNGCPRRTASAAACAACRRAPPCGSRPAMPGAAALCTTRRGDRPIFTVHNLQEPCGLEVRVPAQVRDVVARRARGRLDHALARNLFVEGDFLAPSRRKVGAMRPFIVTSACLARCEVRPGRRARSCDRRAPATARRRDRRPAHSRATSGAARRPAELGQRVVQATVAELPRPQWLEPCIRRCILYISSMS
jgi:hypothetical protein